jgi:type IV secretion system protein VirB9
MKELVLCIAIIATPTMAQTPGAAIPEPAVLAPLPSTPAAPANDPRLQTVRYDVGQVVRLRVATGFQTTVIFGPGEQVENVAIGDSDAWQATLNNQGDALFLKPLRSGGTTNMTVITDVRVYSFELSAAPAPGPDTPFTVRFVYPGANNDDQPATRPGVGRYRLSGARALHPAAIDDDGVKTFIQWRTAQTLPAVFAIDDQGDEILLDGHMRDGRYVVDAVHRALLFRLDGQVARAQRLRERAGR